MKAHISCGRIFMCCTKDVWLSMCMWAMEQFCWKESRITVIKNSCWIISTRSHIRCATVVTVCLRLAHCMHHNIKHCRVQQCRCLRPRAWDFGICNKRKCSCLFHFDPAAGRNLLINNAGERRALAGSAGTRSQGSEECCSFFDRFISKWKIAQSKSR